MNIGKSVEKLEGYSKIIDFGSGVIWPNFCKNNDARNVC